VHVTQIEVQCYRSLWSNPCPGLSPDEFVVVISISLFVKFQAFIGNCLAVTIFGNSISSSILRDIVCMSTGWKHNAPSLV
jgi:hypothetical protein